MFMFMSCPRSVKEIGFSNGCARGFPGLIPPNASLVL